MSSKLEQETLVSFNEAESLVNIFSCSPAVVNKLKKIKGSYESGAGISLDLPKSKIIIELSSDEKKNKVIRIC